MIVPTLESERLVFRAHRTSDWDDCVRLWSDPVVTRFIGGRRGMSLSARYGGCTSWAG